MTADRFKLPQPCLRMFACTFADNESIGNIYIIYALCQPGDTRRSLSIAVLSKSTRFHQEANDFILFILLPTFMYISRHDRRDNPTRCIIVNVSQFLLLRVVLASHCRLSFHNHIRGSISIKMINLFTRLSNVALR